MIKAWAVADEVGTTKVATAMRASEIRKLIAPTVLNRLDPSGQRHHQTERATIDHDSPRQEGIVRSSYSGIG
jgi:hypothetical protein